MLTDGVVAAESEGVGYVGDLGADEPSPSITRAVGGIFSTEGTTMMGAVAERLGTARTGETLSSGVLMIDSETTMSVGLGRAKL